MILGITGSIGSGKTTVAKLFTKHWYYGINADEIGHIVIQENLEVYKKLLTFFGDRILDKNKNIDRNRLGDIVFNDIKKMKKLNSITHPAILKEIKNRIKEIKQKCKDKTKIVIDAPLLLETNTKNLVDKIIVIKCNEDNILKRNKKYPKEKIEKILKLQMPFKEKLKYADFAIDNNKDLEHMKNQVEKIIKMSEIFH